MKAKASSTCADILSILSDGEIHTISQIADEIEVAYITAYRHIQSLSLRYPIEIFRGGDKRGGVYLDKKYLYQGKVRSRDELQIISKALRLLQESGGEVDQETLASLIQEYTLPNQAGEMEL